MFGRRGAGFFTWIATLTAPPVGVNHQYGYGRIKPYDRFNVGSEVFGPYERPIQDATGGGQLYARDLKPFSANSVIPQQWTPVAITGSGSELSGNFAVVGLVDVTSQGANTQQQVV